MSLSRWKMMAGVLGVSLGGLAAAASQCPKMDNTKGGRTEEPVAKAEPPALPPVESVAPVPLTPPTAAMPTTPAPAGPQLLPGAASPVTPPATPASSGSPVAPPATGGALPALPEFPMATAEPKPARPMDVAPTGATMPTLPAIPAGATETKPAAPTDVIRSSATDPKPPMSEVPPKADALPRVPAPDVPPSKPTAPTTPPTSFAPGSVELPGKPAPAPVPPSTGPALPPPALPMTGPAPSAPPAADPLLDVPPSKPGLSPSPTVPDAPAPTKFAKPEATKFRILLRVGEGEPTFEVMHGDNLVLKVACEKVDIKSPEKGQGLSAVTARGKVRFAGFGAEGTCDELSFLAGTGEVSMSGHVNVRVKDKLGRTESELSGESVKYKLDASAVAGTLKP